VIPGALAYTAVTELVERGMFVVFAAGTINGEPTCAWLATPLKPESAAIAHSPAAAVRVGQMIGATVALGDHFRDHGFTPA
jgi:hypothetical protein